MIVHNSHYEKFADGTVRCIDDEIPFEIPSSWQWCRIGDIFNHASGKQQSSLANKVGKPRQFITTSNLYWGYFDLSIVKTMNFTDEEIKNCSATKGDLLVCEGGAGYGRSAIWNEEYDICLQNHVHRLRPFIAGICDYIFFLLYYLKESNQLSSVGTAMPGLSANRLKGILVPLPPLSEQYSIVSQLQSIWPLIKKYDDQYVKLNKLNISVKSHLKKSILQEAIQGKLVLQNWEDEPVSTLLQRIKAEKERLIKEKKIKRDKQESIIFRGDDNCYYEQIGNEVRCIQDEIPFDIPSSWHWVTLAQIASLYTGNSISSIEKEKKYTNVIGTDYIGTKDVGFDNRIEYSNGVAIPNEYIDSFKRARKNDVLICIEGGSAGRKIGMLNKDVCFGNKLCCVSSFGVNQKYLFYYLQSPSFFDSFTNLMSGIISGVSVNAIKTIRIALPPLEEQHRIVDKIEQLFKMLK